MTAVELVLLDACDSTQDHARELLDQRPAGSVVTVVARRQHHGRGRGGRRWVDSPGEPLLMSVGRRGPLPLRVLDDLPRRVIDATLDSVAAQCPRAARSVAWKAPNDLVDAATGAKVAGVLVDSRTRGSSVELVVVGIGINLHGQPFTTDDGRRATSLSVACSSSFDLARLRDDISDSVAALVDPHVARTASANRG